MKDASILIVEDEPLIADDIAMILEKSGFTISEMVDSSLDAIDHLAKNEVDLAMLDINIEGARDGIWLADQINKHFKLPFVFLTSYYDDKTLLRAHSTNPCGYIVKPFDEGDLIANVHLALLKRQPIINSEEDTFFVRDQGELKSVQTDDILYVESDDNYANIHLTDRKVVVPHTLKSVAEKLDGKGFVRCHKSFLINFKKVTSISEGYLFIDQLKLPMGRSYRDNLLRDLPIL